MFAIPFPYSGTARPNGSLLSVASIPSRRILCWRLSTSNSVMVSPSVTPKMRPSTQTAQPAPVQPRAPRQRSAVAGSASLTPLLFDQFVQIQSNSTVLCGEVECALSRVSSVRCLVPSARRLPAIQGAKCSRGGNTIGV